MTFSLLRSALPYSRIAAAKVGAGYNEEGGIRPAQAR